MARIDAQLSMLCDVVSKFDDITTKRLTLRCLAQSDAEAVFAYRCDPAVCEYQTWEPQTLEEIKAFISEMESSAPDVPGSWYQIGVALRETNELIGDIGIHTLLDSRLAEFGITLNAAHQGHGYATEAVVALLDYLFLQLNKHRVSASVDPRNLRSVALMNRVGMRQEAHFVKSLWFKGEWADDLVFAILATEWKAGDSRGTKIDRQES